MLDVDDVFDVVLVVVVVIVGVDIDVDMDPECDCGSEFELELELDIDLIENLIFFFGFSSLVSTPSFEVNVPPTSKLYYSTHKKNKIKPLPQTHTIKLTKHKRTFAECYPCYIQEMLQHQMFHHQVLKMIFFCLNDDFYCLYYFSHYSHC